MVKLRIVENAEEVPDADSTAIDATEPTIPLAVTFTGTGLARSEHFRIAAPPGMFFAAGLLLPRDQANFRYVSESAIDRQVYYTNSAPATGLTAVAMVAPNRRNFVAPASVITVAMFVFLAIGTISGWYRDELPKLTDSVEAIAAIGFFVPGVATEASRRRSLIAQLRGSTITDEIRRAPASAIRTCVPRSTVDS